MITDRKMITELLLSSAVADDEKNDYETSKPLINRLLARKTITRCEIIRCTAR